MLGDSGLNISDEQIQCFFTNKAILLTGGTGSFGNTFTKMLFGICKSAAVVIYSRDEFKQNNMAARFADEVNEKRLRFIIGDVRDEKKLIASFKGIDYVVHAAAMKQVPSCEANVDEAIKTNILGALNVNSAAETCGVKKLVALSSDKAVMPINLYGATKMASEKVFLSGSAGSIGTVNSIVRFGNVANSRGSVIPLFMEIRKNGGHTYPITDYRMTRLWNDMDEAARLVMVALVSSTGGEVFISKMPSFKITDLAKAIDPQAEIKEIGIRQGEKLHEAMITEMDSDRTIDAGDYYVIYSNPSDVDLTKGVFVEKGFVYSSEKNPWWQSAEDLRMCLKALKSSN